MTEQTNVLNLPLQPASQEIYESKYRLKEEDGTPVDVDINATYKRVARALAELEKDDGDKYYHEFLWALENGATPAGRITSNAGASEQKTNVSLINCIVSNFITDSIEGIMQAAKDAGVSLAVGNGIGYEFSTIRPKGAFVSGVGATTSGVLPFMDIFDKMCFTIASAGGRRGAQMATFDIRHPEVLDFIKAKREDGRFSQFNLSVLITDDFIEAVKNNTEWIFSFPITLSRFRQEDADNYIWRDFPITENYVVDDQGLVACEKYGSMPASELWDTIMKSSYDFSEPGFLLIDRINKLNPLAADENIRATNPCGEQPLPPNGSCLLGSINLTKFVIDPFTESARFDMDKYRKVIRIFSRMLDNVVEIHGLVLESQVKEIESKRRHGMGYLGLGSATAMLCIPYGSEESLEFTANVTRELAVEGYTTGVALAKEKGCAPILEDERVRNDFINSEYMQRIFEVDPRLKDEMRKHGCRYTHATSIAPTGSISFSLGNNCCVAKGTKVRTNIGDINVEDVNCDEHKVLIYDSVSNKYSYKDIEFAGLTRPNAEVYKLELDDGTVLNLTHDHKVLVKINEELKYISIDELIEGGIDNYEVVVYDGELDCMLCDQLLENRNQLSAHIRHSHKQTIVQYLYQYKDMDKCIACGEEMSFAEVLKRFKGCGDSSVFCSVMCANNAKARSVGYFKKKYKITTSKALAIFNHKYINRAMFPNQLSYWLKKGLSFSEARNNVSISQNKTSLEAFIKRYGETDGQRQYRKYIQMRSEDMTGDKNHRTGYRYTDIDRKRHKEIMNSDKVVEKQAKAASDYIGRIGVSEYAVSEYLNAQSIDHIHQYSLVLDKEFIETNGIKNKFWVYDFYIPSMNLLIEVDEPFHELPNHKKIDLLRKQYAELKGYSFKSLKVNDEYESSIVELFK